MIRQSLTAAVLLLLATGHALAAGRLRSHVAVTADVVTVGDFYPEAVRAATVPIFRAPDLGTRGQVPAATVAERARAAGHLDAATDGLRQVVVERLAQHIGPREVEAAVRDALAARHPDIAADTLELSLTGVEGTHLVSADLPQPVAVRELAWNRANGRLTARVRIATANRVVTHTVAGRAQEMVEVVAARHPIARGTVITADDLTLQKLPRGRMTDQAVTETSQLVGLAARRSIRADRALRSADFEPPLLVKRGERVTLIYRSGNLTLTTIGQALANGAEGDVVDIVNLQSRRTVSGIVHAHDQVVVGLGHRRLAQLGETN